MSDFKHVNLSALPGGWKADYFGRLVSFRMGKTPPRNQKRFWSEGRYPWVSIADMTPFGIVSETKECVSEEAHNRVFRRALVRPDSLLMSFKLTIGRISQLSVPAYHNEAIISFRPDPANLDPAYLAYHLGQINYRDYQDTAVKGQTLNKGKLAKLEIVLPPLAEQRKIAGVLRLVQRTMEQQERLLALTAELKKALLHQLFTHGLRSEPQNQTEIGPIPQSWDLVSLGRVVDLFNGFAFKSGDAVSSSQTQVVRMGNLHANRLDLSRNPLFYPDHFAERYRRFALQSGDLIMSLTGTSGKEDYGFVVEVPSVPSTLLLNQRVVKLTPTSPKLLKEFLLFFLLSRKFLDHLYPTAKGMKQANLSTNSMKKLLLVIPDVVEQRQIATCFRTLDSKLDVHRRKHAALRALFRTLLHELMTARVRVPADITLPQEGS